MNTKYILCCSTIGEEVIDHIIIDPLNNISYSKQFDITAKNESEAIRAFQESDIFLQFCENHTNIHTYIKENNGYFRKADSIPLTANDEDN